ncbi:MAG: type I-U CRISPR-associated RAMP protein Csb1/Cas7u, partial [Verrucomicrobiota bacterium]
MSDIKQFDDWLEGTGGPAALVLREHLTPVEGRDGVLFPPTFASGDGFPGGYNIDPRPRKDELWPEENVCLVDTVGSQANRIEPLFADDEYSHLIPTVVVKAGEKAVNLVEAGHRAGDALMRCSGLQDELNAAFKAVIMGDASPLAKIAPT